PPPAGGRPLPPRPAAGTDIGPPPATVCDYRAYRLPEKTNQTLIAIVRRDRPILLGSGERITQ
ncbi:MAG: hypothetical protein ABF893_09490, partial [Gluconacetobacter liquefaciens]